MKKHFVSGWYVLYTRPNNEKKVGSGLSQKDINYYLPLIKVVKNLKDRKKLVEIPMFSSYIFVFLADVSDYFFALEIAGVINFVRFGKELAKVKEVIVTNLKIMTEASADLEISVDLFESGQRLFIKEGALSGLYCECVDYKGKEKLLVRVDLLNRNILMDMPADFVTNIMS